MAYEKTSSGMLYSCIQCGKVVTYDQLSLMLEIKCPNCGYRVLRKVRSPIVKRVKAR